MIVRKSQSVVSIINMLKTLLHKLHNFVALSESKQTSAFVKNATVEKDMSKVASMNGIANLES